MKLQDLYLIHSMSRSITLQVTRDFHYEFCKIYLMNMTNILYLLCMQSHY